MANRNLQPRLVGSDREAVWKSLTGCLPAFLYDLERLPIPRKWRAGVDGERYGYSAYHNPELLAKIYEIAPENQLLNIIDDVLGERPHDPNDELTPKGGFRGSANDLWELLRGSRFSFIVEKVVYNSNVMGSSLSKLATQYPVRFAKKIRDGKTIWTIHPLAEEKKA